VFFRWLRALLLTGAGLALMESYLRHGIVGAEDARWYATAVGDFLEQVRAGVFPVWAGQSRFSFYGGIFPLRVAPLLQHAAGVVDLLTGRHLPVFEVLNLTLVAFLQGGLWSCYLCLSRVAPGRTWLCGLLALLYVSCPGVLGLAYAQDLYMSFATLPFLPVIFLGIVRSFAADDLRSRWLMAGGLAATFLAHPPIAMWCGLIAVATQVVRICRLGWSRRAAVLDGAAIAAVGVLGGYPVVSELALKRESAPADVNVLLSVVRQSFPGNWLPLPRAVLLEDLQLGYGLAGLLALGLALSLVRRSSVAILFTAAGALLLAAITPVPFVTALLWRAAPQVIINVGNVWPMQRLLVVLALCTVFGAAILIRETRRTLGIALWLAALVGAVGWSGIQAFRLIAETDRHAPSMAESSLLERPENLPITNMYVWTGSMKAQAPRYASAGVMDPELENRLLNWRTHELLGNTTDGIAPGFGPGRSNRARAPLSGVLTGVPDANPGILNLSPTLTLIPGQRYLLVLGFLEHPYAGTLFLQGRELRRQYHLPHSGEPRAFGSGPESSRVIPLWTSSDRAEDIRLRFAPDPAAGPVSRYTPFARFELRPYHREQLPVQVESLIPYRARVRTAERVYLETPRLAIRGYEATVDGHPVSVQSSPDGYVMLPLEAGDHRVEVRYEAPFSVRASYWIGFAGWIALGVALARRQPAQPSPAQAHIDTNAASRRRHVPT
jgi:hypothetical protein